MKFLKRIAILMALLTVLVGAVSAVSLDEGPQALARYVPAEATIFGATRVDTDFITTLEDLINDVIVQLPEAAGATPINLTEQLSAQMSGEIGLTYEDLTGVVGPYVGMYMSNYQVLMDDDFSNDVEAEPLLIGQLSSAEDGMALLETMMRNEEEPPAFETVNGVTRFAAPNGRGGVIFNDDVFILSPNGVVPDAMPAEVLADDSGFMAATNALPSDSYNAYIYVDTETMMMAAAAADEMFENQLDQLMAAAGDTAIGFTILDEHQLAMEVAQVGVDSSLAAIYDQPLSQDFLRHIPSGTSLFVAGSNLSGYVDAMMSQVNSAFEAQGMAEDMDINSQINQVLGQFDINLQEDILSWTTGGYALTGDIDLNAALSIVADPSTLETLPVSFSFIVEATDSASAATLVEKLTNVLTMAAENQPDVTVAADALNGVDVTRVTANIPAGSTQTIPFSIYLGATDSAFFIGTTDVANYLTGDMSASILDDEAYQRESAYFLPDPVSLAWADSEGWTGLFGGIALVTVFPVSSQTFEMPPEPAQESSESTDAGTRTMIQNSDPMAEAQQVLDTINSLITGSSVTASVDGDTVISRAVIGINR